MISELSLSRSRHLVLRLNYTYTFQISRTLRVVFTLVFFFNAQEYVFDGDRTKARLDQISWMNIYAHGTIAACWTLFEQLNEKFQIKFTDFMKIKTNNNYTSLSGVTLMIIRTLFEAIFVFMLIR